MNQDPNIFSSPNDGRAQAPSLTNPAMVAGESTPMADPFVRKDLSAAATPAAAEYFDLAEQILGAVSRGDGRAQAPVEIEPEANSGKRPQDLPDWPAGDRFIEHQPPSLPQVGQTCRSATRHQYTTEAGEKLAQTRVNLCQRFLELTERDGLSKNQAAFELGKSPSYFSGPDSMLARYQRDGLAGLQPVQSATVTVGDLTAQLESLPWFYPAARFFYLLSNHRKDGGSVPEAIRRVISLPNVPTGWTKSMVTRFLKVINQASSPSPRCDSESNGERVGARCLPAFPAVLRETILSREMSGGELVPERVAKQIRVNASTIKQFRSPREWSLANQSAPGSQRRYFNRATSQREIMLAGDWFGGDDATPGIAVCVPCNEVITPASEKFKVLLGRFQWLAFHDARTDKLLAWDYVVRPRGSYRAEDILTGMGATVRAHGIPAQGFQFEGGSWNSKLVKQAIELLGCQHWRTYSPHQKAIEAVFNKVWTRLSVQFPHADMGRYRNENESNCKLYEACKKGDKDPRRYFPTLKTVVDVFETEVAGHNGHKIFSADYGQWIPDQLFASAINERPLRPFSVDMGWIFSPFSVERSVRGMTVRCRVPMFEDFSVPFDFGADWLPKYNGQKVRLHFNPRQPKCVAKVVLVATGAVLGNAQLIGETAGHIRYILDWATDDQRAGYLQRQRVAHFVRRETRAIGAHGRVEYSSSEERDGLGSVITLERVGQTCPSASSFPSLDGVIEPGSGDPASARSVQADTPAQRHINERSTRSESPQVDAGAAETVAPLDRSARRAALESLRQETDHLFL